MIGRKSTGSSKPFLTLEELLEATELEREKERLFTLQLDSKKEKLALLQQDLKTSVDSLAKKKTKTRARKKSCTRITVRSANEKDTGETDHHNHSNFQGNEPIEEPSLGDEIASWIEVCFFISCLGF